MAASTFVGSFTVPAATGNNAVTGVGFQPKAVIFWGDVRQSDGSFADNINGEMPTFWGVATSSTARGCIVSASDWNTSHNIALTNVCVSQRNSGGTVSYAADFVSMDADGFTVNFSTANAFAYVINYLAIGGSDVSAIVLTNTTPAGTGNQAWTGAGFQPSAVLIAADATTAQTNRYAHLAIGAANSTTSRWAVHTGMFSAGTTANRVVLTNAVTARISPTANSIIYQADLNTFGSDGFTLNYSTAATGYTMVALCLGGTAQYKAGTITQRTSTGSQATTGVGFQPVGLHTVGLWTATAGSIQSSPTDMGDSTGAASSATARAVVATNEGSTQGATRLDRTRIYARTSDTPTTVAEADFTSFDSDGFTLNYGTADTNAYYIGYLAVGSAAGGGGASRALSSLTLMGVQ